MTAIFGVVRYDAADPQKEADVLRRVLANLGDDPGTLRSEGPVSLGRNLTHFLEEDVFDRQPIAEPGSRYVVVADVHLSERDALIARLDVSDAEERSDAWLAATAIEQWHEDAFDRLYGSFAIAAWDRREQRLLLARDHFGYRPIVFHRSLERFCFASTPAGLRALPGVPHGFDAGAMRHYLRFGSPPRDHTCFAGIEQVRPGHYAIVTREEVRQRRYWQPDITPLRLPDHADYAAEFGRLFESAVRASLRGVKHRVAAHLSGGFDSTAVVTTAARMLAEADTRISAYTAVPRSGFVENGQTNDLEDEGDIAAATAAFYPNVDHRRIHGEDSSLAELDRNALAFGEPLAAPCNQTWISAINDAARDQGCRVLLLGAMGNASISDTGTAALPELFRAGRIGEWFKVARGFVRRGTMRWNNVIWRTAAPFLPVRWWLGLRNLRGRESVPASYCSPMRDEFWDDLTLAAEDRNVGAHPLDKDWTDEWPRHGPTGLYERLGIMNTDLGNYYKGVLAIWGLDWRDPTGDRRLCEFALRVPIEHVAWQGETKALLRAYLGNTVPSEVLDNPRSGLQGSDWSLGFDKAKSQIDDEVGRIADFAASAELIDVERIERLIKSWPAAVEEGRLKTIAGAVDYRMVVLRAVATAAFMRKASGSNY